MTDLRLDHNEIEDLPWDVFYDLENVIYVSLTDNRIKKLPGKLLNPLRKLNWFTADMNQIEKVDEELFSEDLKELEAVNLSKNRLRKIFVDFRKITSLRFVDLKENVCVDVFVDANDVNFHDKLEKSLENCK